MVRTSGNIFVNHNLRLSSLQPIVNLPGIFCKSFTNQNTLLLLHTDRICSDPKREPNHFRLVDDVVIEGRAKINPHWPNFLILRIAIRVDLSCRVTVRGAAATGPIHTSHVQIDVIGNSNIGIVLFDVIIRPVITTTLSTFFTRPKAKHHRSSSVISGHRFSDGQYHACAR